MNSGVMAAVPGGIEPRPCLLEALEPIHAKLHREDVGFPQVGGAERAAVCPVGREFLGEIVRGLDPPPPVLRLGVGMDARFMLGHGAVRHVQILSQVTH